MRTRNGFSECVSRTSQSSADRKAPWMLRRHYLSLLFAMFLTVPAWPQQKPVDLTEKSMEDLMNIEVTSVSKKGEKLARTAAAIFVITAEDIRRSGATTIPDLLRMVPGLDVAQINGSSWAVSSRGFNDQSANKLLVLIDGRTVYSPLFNGVFWDVQEVPLEDIERIEVIRGPGAAVWGANAVNGVISIISKEASDTQGLLVTVGGGTHDGAFGTAQYGGRLGANTTYRVDSDDFSRNHLANLAGQNGNDGWNVHRAGFRVDRKFGTKDSLTIQGDGYGDSEGEVVANVTSLMPPSHRYRTCVKTSGDGTFCRGGTTLFHLLHKRRCKSILTAPIAEIQHTEKAATHSISIFTITLHGEIGRISCGDSVSAPHPITFADLSGPVSIRPRKQIYFLAHSCRTKLPSFPAPCT